MITAISGAANNIDPANLASIDCPVLVVHGDRDPLVSNRHALELYEHIPDSALLVLPGAGHSAHLERPDVFIRAFTEFLTTGESVVRNRLAVL
jgi:pimeloyl-ACP methyl ester carboxylesterase